MQIGDVILFSLLATVIIQQVFWAHQVQRLVDKLMSKNYYDYEASKAVGKPQPKIILEDPSAQEDLRFINPI